MTYLYRAYNGAGRLLYVGIAEDIWQRMGQHEINSPWIDDLAAMDVERYRTRTEARAAERAAIATEWPLWNIDGAVDGRMTQQICWQRKWEQVTRPAGVLSEEERERHFQWCLERGRHVRRVTRTALRCEVA